MSMNKTRYLRKAMLDHFLGRISYAFPTNVYAALFSADPTELGTLTNELSQSGYARIEISDKLSDAVLASGVISNSLDIVFGPAGADWPEVTHIGIMDSAGLGTGNMLYHVPAITSRTVPNSDEFKIRAGQLTIQEQ